MNNYTDLHVHIDHYENPIKILLDYERRAIYSLFVTNMPELFKRSISLVQNFKYVRLALGYHPNLISQFPFDRSLFNQYCGQTDYIGEVGLDFSPSLKLYKEEQERIFFEILESPNISSKLLSIHSRQAEQRVVEILGKKNIKFAIFHWYNGPLKLIPEIIERGYYFSINPSMLLSHHGQKVLQAIPLNRILFETDGPFTKFDNRVIQPSDFELMYLSLGSFYSIGDIKKQFFHNFRDLILNLRKFSVL